MFKRFNDIANFILFLFTLLAMRSAAQSLHVNTISSLPSVLTESSGLTSFGNLFWSFNDSDGKAEIHSFDSLGNYFRTVELLNSHNVDWEEISCNEAGDLIIGDFGNNNNDRRNLKIYWIPDFQTISSNKVNTKSLSFEYGHQSGFPPGDAFKNFDMEAMIYKNDSIHLFSKNRTNPFSGYCYQYTLPLSEGHYIIYPRDSFVIGTNSSFNDWVTAAALSPNGDKLVLLNHGKINLFYDYTGTDFFKGKRIVYTLDHYSQKEGICFNSQQNLFLTDERVFGNFGNLYRIELPVVNSTESFSQTKICAALIAQNELTTNFSGTFDIYSVSGIFICTLEANEAEPLDISFLARGIYLMKGWNNSMMKLIKF